MTQDKVGRNVVALRKDRHQISTTSGFPRLWLQEHEMICGKHSKRAANKFEYNMGINFVMILLQS